MTGHTHARAAAKVESPHAGKGSSVLLDIGGDVGALVIDMPASMEGLEIELRPQDGSAPQHSHDSHVDGNHHHLPHVAVVPRSSPDGRLIHSAVFFEVPQGGYELYVRPDGPVQLTSRSPGEMSPRLAGPNRANRGK